MGWLALHFYRFTILSLKLRKGVFQHEIGSKLKSIMSTGFRPLFVFTVLHIYIFFSLNRFQFYYYLEYVYLYQTTYQIFPLQIYLSLASLVNRQSCIVCIYYTLCSHKTRQVINKHYGEERSQNETLRNSAMYM